MVTSPEEEEEDNDEFEEENLAEAWGAAFEEQGVENDGVSAQWAAMVDDGDSEGDGIQHGSERILNQEEIDNLLGFTVNEKIQGDKTGIQALINSNVVSYERLPMLEIVFDRLVRLSTTSLRNFTSDNVEVTLNTISSVRFGDYVNSIPLPAIIGVMKAVEWENYGLVVVDSSLIYSIIDVLLGGGRGTKAIRVEGRPYTTIELSLVRRMLEIILEDTSQAFAPLSPVTFKIDRLESNPRFAPIARPANAAILAELSIDMEDRGGTIKILLPFSTLEPIRSLLLQMFTGEKFGRDDVWEQHFATEIYNAEVMIDAVLFENRISLKKIMDLKVGQTLLLNKNPDDPVDVKCGDIKLTTADIGQLEDKMSIRIAEELIQPQTSLESFEQSFKNETGASG